MSRASTAAGSARASVLIVFPDGYIGVAPTILGLSEVLAERGYRVTIVGNDPGWPLPAGSDEHIDIRLFRSPIRNHAFGRIWLVLRAVTTVFNSDRSQLNVVVGVDRVGSTIGYLISLLVRRPLWYLSLELPSESRGIRGLLRWIARRAFRSAACVIVQDDVRFTSLCQVMRHAHPTRLLLPNAPRGSRASNEPDQQMLQRRLGIDESRFPTVVLSAGMIEDAVYSRELAEAFADVDTGYALVLHDRVRRDPRDPYLVDLQRINQTNLFVSLEPVDVAELDALYASADIGVAYYRDLDDNFGEIALASGKLAYYLKHGLPVLVNSIPSLRGFVTENRCGVVIEDPADGAELRAALATIRRDYDEFRANALHTFATKLDFDVNVQPVLDRLHP